MLRKGALSRPFRRFKSTTYPFHSRGHPNTVRQAAFTSDIIENNARNDGKLSSYLEYQRGLSPLERVLQSGPLVSQLQEFLSFELSGKDSYRLALPCTTAILMFFASLQICLS